MLDLYDELRSVVTALNAAGIPHALVGGLAYSFLVESRATEDIDLLIPPGDWPRVKETLAPLGYTLIAGGMDFANIRIRRLTKIEGGDSLVLDFLLADGEHRNAFTKAIRLRDGGVDFAVAPVETIIALKRGRMSAKDQSDIEGLERLLRGKQP